MGLCTLALNLWRCVWVHGLGRRFRAYNRKSSVGYKGREIRVRVDARRMALGRQNMYFSSFIWMGAG